MDRQLETKEVFVKPHVRIIKQRVYRFVCKQCQQVVERICFPSHPLYCEKCRPPKPTANKPPVKLSQSRRRAKAS